MRRILFILCAVLSSILTSAQGNLQYIQVPTKILDGVTSRDCMVYLPPSYGKGHAKTYPVLYLLHGGGCPNTQFETEGHIHVVADSLIKAGAINEMIIVCPDANKDNMIWFNDAKWRFEDYMFTELIPYIEQHYQVKCDKVNRAIAGFSMGGGGTVGYAIHHPDMFCAAYAMSAYLRSQPLSFLKNDPLGNWRQQNVDRNNPMEAVDKATDNDLNKYRKIRWFIDCGDDDFTFSGNMALVEAFRKHDIAYELRVKNGGHDWSYWRPAVVEALKYVFNK